MEMQQIETKNKDSFQLDRAGLIKKLKKNRSSKKQIKKRNINQLTPLSFSQERLWVMSELEVDNPIYNVAGAMQFTGMLNTVALQQSLNEVLRRHEILRSRFLSDKQGTVQRVMPDKQLSLSQIDLQLIDPSTKNESFQQQNKQAITRFYRCTNDFIRLPFELSSQPPLRGMLAKIGEQQHILLLTLHHMVSDRWSVGVLMQEVAALYASYNSGIPSALMELPIQYGDFSIWHRQQTDRWEKHLESWRPTLSGVPPLLELPSDYPRPPVQRFHGDMYEFEISQSVNKLILH